MTRTPYLAVAVLFLLAAAARASDPVGIYAVIDKVVLEPSARAPERIQVWGVFALARPPGDSYTEPARGYLYYSLNPDQPEATRKEWADLKKMAGSTQCVAFGSRHKEKGTVRKASEMPNAPDVYPVGFGLQKVDADNPQAQKLKELARPPDKQAATTDKIAATRRK
jgi:hypothetical protein